MAAERTPVEHGVVAPHVTSTGSGMKVMTYTVTKTTPSDWVVLSDFTSIRHAWAQRADGSSAENIIMSTTTAGHIQLSADATSGYSVNLTVIGW